MVCNVPAKGKGHANDDTQDAQGAGPPPAREAKKRQNQNEVDPIYPPTHLHNEQDIVARLRADQHRIMQRAALISNGASRERQAGRHAPLHRHRRKAHTLQCHHCHPCRPLNLPGLEEQDQEAQGRERERERERKKNKSKHRHAARSLARHSPASYALCELSNIDACVWILRCWIREVCEQGQGFVGDCRNCRGVQRRRQQQRQQQQQKKKNKEEKRGGGKKKGRKEDKHSLFFFEGGGGICLLRATFSCCRPPFIELSIFFVVVCCCCGCAFNRPAGHNEIYVMYHTRSVLDPALLSLSASGGGGGRCMQWIDGCKQHADGWMDGWMDAWIMMVGFPFTLYTDKTVKPLGVGSV